MSKIEEKIDKAARDYRMRAFLAVGEANNQLAACTIKDFEDAFKAGVRWAMSHQWVSVEDELPPFNGNPILRRDTSYRVALCIWINDRFVDLTNNEDFVATHWMPIPPPPEARKEDI